MRPPVLRIHHDELVVDSFAGGGGASLGIEMALGRSPDIAVNHDPEAVAMHSLNHPSTRHYCQSVWEVDPKEVCGGRPVALAWFSPDCKHFSKAKGGKPVDKKIRSLAWVVTRWARAVKPRVICLENVEEFQDWGPLGPDNKPDWFRRGLTFRRWVGQLRGAGYHVEARQLRACDFGAPTSRKRLFVIARSDGQPIVWPEPTHGPGLLPYRTAAEIIDWTLPCPSIFDRKRPLADATLRRIARGMRKFVLDSADPYVVDLAAYRARSGLVAPALVQTGYGEREGQAPRCLDLQQPLGTIVAQGQKHAVVAAFLARNYGGHENDGGSLSAPVHTITTKDHHALVTVSLRDGSGTRPGEAASAGGSTGRDGLEAPQPERDAAVGAKTGRDHSEERLPDREGARRRAAVSGLRAPAGLDGASGSDPWPSRAEPHRRGQDEQRPLEPRAGDAGGEPSPRVPARAAGADGLPCSPGPGGEDPQGAGVVLREDRGGAARVSDDGVPGHALEVAAFLSTFYGQGEGQDARDPLRTITTKDRFALVTVAGQRYAVSDIGLRMLAAPELFLGQGFPASYRLDVELNGKPLTQTALVRLVGNSVSPPVAEAIIRANVGAAAAERKAG